MLVRRYRRLHLGELLLGQRIAAIGSFHLSIESRDLRLQLTGCSLRLRQWRTCLCTCRQKEKDSKESDLTGGDDQSVSHRVLAS